MGFAPIKWTCTAFFRPRQLTDRAILANRQTQEKKKRLRGAGSHLPAATSSNSAIESSDPKLPTCGHRASCFFCCERLSASMARSLHLSFICIPQSTRALDQGGVEPRQAVSPKALRPWTIPLRYSVGCGHRAS